MFKIITIFILINLNLYLYAFEYYSSANFNLYDLSTPSNTGFNGYLKQEISDDKFAFHFNLWLNNPETIYDFSTTAPTLDTQLDLYSMYSVSHNIFYVGYMDSLASKNFIYEILGREELFLGVNTLNQRQVNNSSFITHFIIPDAYMSNESAFSLSYLYGALDNRLYLGITYTPNLSSTLGTNSSIATYENVQSAFDSVFIYYSEYNALGYGARLASRVYNYSNAYYNANQEPTFDFSSNIYIDYLGFAFETGVMFGQRTYANSDLAYDVNYTAFESSLSYAFGAWSTGVNMLDSTISGTDNLLVEYEILYNINVYTNINLGFIYENLDYEINKGVLIGLSVMY